MLAVAVAVEASSKLAPWVSSPVVSEFFWTGRGDRRNLQLVSHLHASGLLWQKKKHALLYVYYEGPNQTNLIFPKMAFLTSEFYVVVMLLPRLIIVLITPSDDQKAIYLMMPPKRVFITSTQKSISVDSKMCLDTVVAVAVSRIVLVFFHEILDSRKHWTAFVRSQKLFRAILHKLLRNSHFMFV